MLQVLASHDVVERDLGSAVVDFAEGVHFTAVLPIVSTVRLDRYG